MAGVGHLQHKLIQARNELGPSVQEVTGNLLEAGCFGWAGFCCPMERYFRRKLGYRQVFVDREIIRIRHLFQPMVFGHTEATQEFVELLDSGQLVYMRSGPVGWLARRCRFLRRNCAISMENAKQAAKSGRNRRRQQALQEAVESGSFIGAPEANSPA